MFDAKADALAAARSLGAPVDKLQVEAGGPAWYPSGPIRHDQARPEDRARAFGEFHPKTLEALDVSGPLAGFEVFLDAVPDAKAKPTRTKPTLDLSAFQPVRRDFAFVVDKRRRGRHADARRALPPTAS